MAFIELLIREESCYDQARVNAQGISNNVMLSLSKHHLILRLR